MFEVSWSEMVILATVALVFVGPKELPSLLRTFGRYARLIKAQADELRAQLDVAINQAELDAVRMEIESMRNSAQAGVSGALGEIEVASSLSASPSSSPPPSPGPSAAPANRKRDDLDAAVARAAPADVRAAAGDVAAS